MVVLVETSTLNKKASTRGLLLQRLGGWVVHVNWVFVYLYMDEPAIYLMYVQ